MSLAPNRLKLVATFAVAAALGMAAIYGLMLRMGAFTGRQAAVRSAASLRTSASGPSLASVAGVITRPDGSPQTARVTLVPVTNTLRPAQARGRGGPFG